MNCYIIVRIQCFAFSLFYYSEKMWDSSLDYFQQNSSCHFIHTLILFNLQWMFSSKEYKTQTIYILHIVERLKNTIFLIPAEIKKSSYLNCAYIFPSAKYMSYFFSHWYWWMCRAAKGSGFFMKTTWKIRINKRMEDFLTEHEQRSKSKICSILRLAD